MSLTTNNHDCWNGRCFSFNLRTQAKGKTWKKNKIKFSWLFKFWSERCILISFILYSLMAGVNRRSCIKYPVGIHLLKVNNEKSTTGYIIYSKLTKKYIGTTSLTKKTLRNIDIVLVSPLLTLKRFHTFS